MKLIAKIKAKLNKLIEFWKLYKKWCKRFDIEFENLTNKEKRQT